MIKKSMNVQESAFFLRVICCWGESFAESLNILQSASQCEESQIVHPALHTLHQLESVYVHFS